MAKRRRGRPLNDDDFLAMEVHRVMRAHRCGVRKACKRIERGMERDKVPLAPRGGTLRWTLGSPWKGERFRTLETRYERWIKREKERQKKLTVKIP